MDDVGQRLRDARTARGLTLRELARRIGVSPSLISQIENGRSRPSVSTLYAIATELRVSVDDVLFETAPGDLDAVVEATEPAAVPLAGLNGAVVADPPATPARAGVGPVQRAADRKVIELESGVRWERLTAAHDANVDFLYTTYAVGGSSSTGSVLQRHAGREYGLILSGRLRVTLGFEEYDLGPGDSINYDSMTPHRLLNIGDEPVIATWIVIGRGSAEPEPFAP